MNAIPTQQPHCHELACGKPENCPCGDSNRVGRIQLYTQDGMMTKAYVEVPESFFQGVCFHGTAWDEGYAQGRKDEIEERDAERYGIKQPGYTCHCTEEPLAPDCKVHRPEPSHNEACCSLAVNGSPDDCCCELSND